MKMKNVMVTIPYKELARLIGVDAMKERDEEDFISTIAINDETIAQLHEEISSLKEKLEAATNSRKTYEKWWFDGNRKNDALTQELRDVTEKYENLLKKCKEISDGIQS